MRNARILPDGHHFYHCLSRVVDRRFIFDSEEKQHFRSLMRRLETFSGLRVVTYCLMSNHFHILLEVPEREAVLPENEPQLLARIATLYGRGFARRIGRELEDCRKDGRTLREEQIRSEFLGRMGDLSVFMKMLKQRFSSWYNARNNRKGTLWEERFKSVIVENTHEAMLAMAAYIDLNPVRAGMVDDPKDYRWCGYGEAVAGGARSRRGLAIALEAERIARNPNHQPNWRTVGREYRRLLYGVGEEKITADGERVQGGISRGSVQKSEAKEHQLSLNEALRCRVRYFSDGAAIGSRQFIDGIFQANRDKFGSRRRTGARPMQNADWSDLCSLRELRKDVIRPPDS